MDNKCVVCDEVHKNYSLCDECHVCNGIICMYNMEPLGQFKKGDKTCACYCERCDNLSCRKCWTGSDCDKKICPEDVYSN